MVVFKRCRLLCCFFVVFGALNALMHPPGRLNVRKIRVFISRVSGNCPPVLSGSVSDRTCTWIAVRRRYNPGYSGSAQAVI